MVSIWVQRRACCMANTWCWTKWSMRSGCYRCRTIGRSTTNICSSLHIRVSLTLHCPVSEILDSVSRMFPIQPTSYGSSKSFTNWIQSGNYSILSPWKNRERWRYWSDLIGLLWFWRYVPPVPNTYRMRAYHVFGNMFYLCGLCGFGRPWNPIRFSVSYASMHHTRILTSMHSSATHVADMLNHKQASPRMLQRIHTRWRQIDRRPSSRWKLYLWHFLPRITSTLFIGFVVAATCRSYSDTGDNDTVRFHGIPRLFVAGIRFPEFAIPTDRE